MQYLAGLIRFYFLFSFFPIAVYSQPPQYQKGYFRWPLSIQPEIVANLGELRTNHWHMGLDIRTAQRVNQSVYAAAAGYISRIRVEPFGFGRAIYINHPNGLTTLYAHLNDFFPALENYVRSKQYEKESWAIELEFSPDQFPVNKGSFIAFSGTTGGSQGPHLHFEIRDTRTGKCLNPMMFGFPLTDQVPPTLTGLGMYDRSHSIYEQKAQFFPLRLTGSKYAVSGKPVLRTGLKKISFSIQAYDRISGSSNRDGIYSAKLFLDGGPRIGFELDSIGYEETGYMNAHIDFSHKYHGGSYYQHLSELPSDRGGVYKEYDGDGIIYLEDSLVHRVRIEVRDAYINLSVLEFDLQYDENLPGPIIHPTDHEHMVPGKANMLNKEEFEAYLPDYCLFDTIPVFYSKFENRDPGYLSARHRFNEPDIPVHRTFTVRIKPENDLPGKWYDKVVIQREFGGKKNVRKARVENGYLVADFGDFGNFQAFLDLDAPSINEPGRGDTINLSAAKTIVFRPSDNFGIGSFRAELDDHWLRFTNDKGSTYIYVFDEHCPYGVHKLKVTVTDLVGNSTEKTWWFKRYPYTPPRKKPATRRRK